MDFWEGIVRTGGWFTNWERLNLTKSLKFAVKNQELAVPFVITYHPNYKKLEHLYQDESVKWVFTPPLNSFLVHCKKLISCLVCTKLKIPINVEIRDVKFVTILKRLILWQVLLLVNY